jgi:PAS domain S-box-containing protein
LPGDRFIELAMAEDRHVLDVLFRHATGGVTVQERSGRVIYANDEAAKLIGLATGQEMMSTAVSKLISDFEMIDESGNPISVDELPGRRVLAGEAVAELTVGYRRRGSSQVRWSRINASPIKNDAREVVWVVNFFLDVTEQFRRREREKLLAKAHEALGTTLDFEDNLQVLADLVVPQLGTWCAVTLLDDDGYLTQVAAEFPQTDEARALVEVSRPLRMPLDADHLAARVVRTGRPEVVPVVAEEVLEAAATDQTSDAIDLARRMGIVSVACVPLWVGGSCTGALTVARSHVETQYDDLDIELLNEVAQAAAASLINARLYSQEHELAETLQRGLIPTVIPTIPGVEIAVRYLPLAPMSRVGGDFYDVVVRTPDEFAIVVGDVEGKGIPAAARVGLIRHTLRATIALDPRAKTVINQLTDALRQDEPDPRMCTLAYFVVERHPDHFEICVSLAGHPPVLLVTNDGVVRPLGRPCPPTGVMPQLEPSEERAVLAPGDTVLVYTDGFAIASVPAPENITPLLAGAADESLDDLLDRLLLELQKAKPVQQDDVVLLAMRVG